MSDSKIVKNAWRKACVSLKEVEVHRTKLEEQGEGDDAKRVYVTRKVKVMRRKGKATTSLRMWVRNRIREVKEPREAKALAGWMRAKGMR